MATPLHNLSKLVEHATDAILLLDEEGLILYANPACSTLFGRPHAALIGQPLGIATAVDDPDEVQLIHPRHGVLTASLRTAAIEGAQGEPLTAVYLRDMSEQAEVRQRLEEARQLAEAAAQTKGHFLANMSHEIRTPLNAIIGLGEALAETPLNREQQRYLATLSRAGDHLLELVNDILDLARFEAGRIRLNRERFDLHELLDQLQELLSLRAQEKGLLLAFDRQEAVPQWIVADKRRLRQVLINLLGNAVKFTRHGRVSLQARLEALDTAETALCFHIQDTGIGIPEAKQLEVIYEPFFQIDESATRVHGGSGLGLPISLTLADLMGGWLCLRSQPDQGTRVSVALPMAALTAAAPEAVQPAVPAPTPAPAEDTLSPLRILLAEDSPDNVLLVKTFLKATPYRLDVADNGREALRRWQTTAYDLILMDVQMPEMDGHTATRRIRAQERATQRAHTPIIALTASALSEDQAQSLAAGCDAHLSKPIRKQQLIAVIEASRAYCPEPA